MNEFNHTYFVDRNNARALDKGETRIKFRAPSFANAKIRRYKIPVEPAVNQVKNEDKVNDSKNYEMLTKSQERLSHRSGARERALKLKEIREKKLASIPAVITSSLGTTENAVPVSANVQRDNQEQVNISAISASTPVMANGVTSSIKPAALEDTQFNLGGVLETVKHEDAVDRLANAVETTATPDMPKEAQLFATEPSINVSLGGQQEASVTQITTPVTDANIETDIETDKNTSVAEEEIDATIDFSSKDSEQIYNELIKARDETTAAMEKASAIAAEVEKAKEEFNKKIEESDQKLQEAGAEMENTKLQAEASQTRYKGKITEFRNAAAAQSRALKSQRDRALQAAVASEQELEEVRRNSEEKLTKNEQHIAQYNDQIKQDQATISEYDEKTERLDAILKAISEPIETAGNYVPSASIANFMITPDSQMNVSESAPVKKAA